MRPSCCISLLSSHGNHGCNCQEGANKEAECAYAHRPLVDGLTGRTTGHATCVREKVAVGALRAVRGKRAVAERASAVAALARVCVVLLVSGGWAGIVAVPCPQEHAIAAGGAVFVRLLCYC